MSSDAVTLMSPYNAGALCNNHFAEIPVGMSFVTVASVLIDILWLHIMQFIHNLLLFTLGQNLHSYNQKFGAIHPILCKSWFCTGPDLLGHSINWWYLIYAWKSTEALPKEIISLCKWVVYFLYSKSTTLFKSKRIQILINLIVSHTSLHQLCVAWKTLYF